VLKWVLGEAFGALILAWVGKVICPNASAPIKKCDVPKWVLGEAFGALIFAWVGNIFVRMLCPYKKNGTAFKLIYLTVDKRLITLWHRQHFQGIKPQANRETGDGQRESVPSNTRLKLDRVTGQCARLTLCLTHH
jgi:large-conductance mechanosensitive channel